MTNSINTRCSCCGDHMPLPVFGGLSFPFCPTCKETYFANRQPESMDFLAKELHSLAHRTDHPLLAALFYLDYNRLELECLPEWDAVCTEFADTFNLVCTRFSAFFPQLFYHLGLSLQEQGALQAAYDAFDQSISTMNADLYFNFLQEHTNLEGQLALSFRALADLERQLGRPVQADEWERMAACYGHLHRLTANELTRRLETDAGADPAAYTETLHRMAEHYDNLAARLAGSDHSRIAALQRQAEALRSLSRLV